MKEHMKHVITAGAVLAVLAVGAGAFAYSGMYNIGADEPHWMPTMVVIDKLRERSIATRMADATVPNLEDPARIAAGTANYSAMCTGCHLAPGVTDTEIRPGLYPMPPDLSRVGSKNPKRTFWIIKHGIKMSAMPAWGKTHTDEQIWNMVAFISKMPGMTPAQYLKLGGKMPVDDDDHMKAAMGSSPGSMDMHGMESMDHDAMHHDGQDDHDHHQTNAAPAATATQVHADGEAHEHVE